VQIKEMCKGGHTKKEKKKRRRKKRAQTALHAGRMHEEKRGEERSREE
jgi:hypothetical protein